MHTFRPYLQLIRYNHNYRRLWLSQAVANFGDWFGMLAIYALIQKYSGSELLIGLIIVVKLLSFAAFSPFAGYLADRFDRKNLMYFCDIGRSVVVLGLLFVQSESLLWAVYLIISIQMMMAATFEPAKSSSIPNITTKEELVVANVISTLTWSIIFTTGMAIGGFFTAWFGVNTVFVINALTYVLSAWFIKRAVIPNLRTQEQLTSLTSPIDGIIKGFRFLYNENHILRPTVAKAWIQSSLGALVYLLILVSDDVLLMGSIGLGILYASRGLGTAIGPILIRRFYKNEEHWIRILGVCMAIVGSGYLLLGFTTSLWVMIFLVIFAHAGSGANWVASTILIQQRTPDEYRGRVFSSEWLLLTISESLSVMIAAGLLHFEILSLQWTIVYFGAQLIMMSIIWHLIISKAEMRWQKKGALSGLRKKTLSQA